MSDPKTYSEISDHVESKLIEIDASTYPSRVYEGLLGFRELTAYADDQFWNHESLSKPQKTMINEKINERLLSFECIALDNALSLMRGYRLNLLFGERDQETLNQMSHNLSSAIVVCYHFVNMGFTIKMERSAQLCDEFQKILAIKTTLMDELRASRS